MQSAQTMKCAQTHMMDSAGNQQLAELCGKVSCTIWDVCVTDTQDQHHRKRQIRSADRPRIWQDTKCCKCRNECRKAPY